MNLPINPTVKPFYSSLLRLEFPKYLIADSFDQLLIELNIDDLWVQCEDFVREQSNVMVLVPGYTGDAEKALGLFLTKLLEKGGQEFIRVIGRILLDFNQWKKTQVDYTSVQEKLLELGFSNDEIAKIFLKIDKIEVVSKKVSPVANSIDTKKVKTDPKLCFVLIPFSVRFEGIYNVIKSVVENKGYTCLKADEIYSNHPVIQDIIENIFKANFIIADLTEKNPNVMYELGIAHQINKQKTILISQNSNDIPFDLNYLRTFIYEDSFGGIEIFQKGLIQHIDFLVKNKKIATL